MKPEIIAELAQGFEGSKQQAMLLLKAAASSGADSAKFQIVFAEELATKDYKHYQLFSSLEMKDSDWIELNEFAIKNKLNLYTDVFGKKSLKLSEKMNLKAIKVHGTDISNISFLKEIAKSKIPKVFLGVGGANKKEISIAIKILKNKKINLMLGFQSYPTPNKANQLSRMHLFKKIFKDKELGFADHSNPQEKISYILPSVAMTLGAAVIEKHLTLGKLMKIEDFESALNPDEFKIFSTALKQSYQALGTYKNIEDFGMSSSESSYRKMIRRDVVASKNIKKGVKINHSHLSLKRTSNQNALKNFDIIIGKKVLRNLKKNCSITKKDIE
tara:strand:- start:7659 stop:8648 length:990 start_codon:yes stop_codon:yes gene_type:complete